MRETEGQNAHSEKITNFIKAVMDEVGIDYSKLDAVAVSQGPGSYTGLRIGVSTAKGVCYAADLPLMAIDTLEAMAYGMKEKLGGQIEPTDLLIPMIDARRMEVYAAVFDANLNNSQSTYNDAYDPRNRQAREYIIGIADADVSALEKALFDGVRSAHANPVHGSGNLSRDNTNDLSVDSAHNLRIATDGNGSYYFTKDRSPSLDIYDTSPLVNTAAYKEQPLVIHHGTEANQSLNVYFNDMRLDALKLTGTGTAPRDYAALSLCYVEHAIEYALNEATRMGAYRSRLEMTEANLVTANENTIFAESTIRDADMAKEMTNYTKNNVLLQAAQSMLAQANQNSSGVLSLLQ